MITLNTDMYLLASRLNISTAKIEKYGSKSIDEIVQAEALQGNTQAQTNLSQIFSSPAELVKVFKLADPNNRFAILSNMNQRDLTDILPLLEAEDLVIGLNFFTKDKLMELVGKIPKEQLVKYVSQMFSPEQIMQLMPEENIDKVLKSPDMDKGLVLKYLKTLKPEILAQMVEAATGKPAKSTDPDEMIKQIGGLSADKYNDALTSIPPQNKRFFVLQMIKEQPKILEMFDAEGYVKIINRKEKPDLVKSASAIEPDQLVKMIGQLPQDLLSIVVTQIDPSKFADVLIKNFKDILGKIVAG